MEYGSILALDLASRTGWAYGAPGDGPLSGSILLAKAGSSRAVRYRALREWLEAWLATNPTRQITFEAPLTPEMVRGHTNIETIRFLVGLAEHIAECVQGTGIAVTEHRVSDVRSHFLGTARLKRDAAKQATMRKCFNFGWRPVDDNAGDALALWHLACSKIKPELAIQCSPLFRGLA